MVSEHRASFPFSVAALCGREATLARLALSTQRGFGPSGSGRSRAVKSDRLGRVAVPILAP
jgi:hypothetical protein